MKLHSIALIMFVSLLVSNCSKPDIKEFAVTASDGTRYHCKVVVPLMNYVRVRPLTPANQLKGEVEVPPTVYYDKTRFVVTQIASGAFAGYTGITKVRIPSTISVIESKAFSGCSAMGEINTPQPLSTLGDYAFENCSSLAVFDMQASISSLGEGCFAGCSSLASIRIPTSLNTIPDKCFKNCSGVDNIYISSTVNAIGAEAFSGCTGVTRMTSAAGMPPAASGNTFNGIDANIPVTVPMGGLSYYQSAEGWKHFNSYTGSYDIK